MHMIFDGKIALVTGAAKGIGSAAAILLAQRGCDVAINFRTDEAGARETAQAVEQTGRRALLLQADVAQADQADAMVEAVIEQWGRIDVLVNNAGITCDKLLVSAQSADIEPLIRTNLLGTIYVTRAAAKQMVQQRWGRIVNISSSAAGKPGRGQSIYAATKGAVEAFTRAMAVELASRNILVNAVAPGVIETAMSAQIRQHAEDEIMKRLLLKRYAEPVEVAEAIAFLASPANLYMTGEVLHLDGGMKMA